MIIIQKTLYGPFQTDYEKPNNANIMQTFFKMKSQKNIIKPLQC